MWLQNCNMAMFHKMVIKRVFIPLSAPALIAATVITSNEKEDKKELIRPRDLPIYKKPTQSNTLVKITEEPKPESFLTLAVRTVREEVWAVNDQLGQVSDQVNHIIETGKAHTSTSVQILREEDNYVQRYGAISAGGLLGYVLALRRGKLRRLLNTATGAAIIASVCYPEQAKELSAEGYREAKRYFIVSYHFVNGVLRDYVGVQLPSLPGPLSIGSATAAEKDSSTVPRSATLMPPPASTPSHIPASGPIPLPPIDKPSSVTDAK